MKWKRQLVLILLLLVVGMIGGAFAASSTGSYTQQVNKATPGSGGVTPVTVTSNNNPSAFQTSVTFTAAVPSNATGTVSFMDGATQIGSNATISSGAASVSTTTLSVGAHSITAVYNGDSNFNSATSTALTQTVGKGTSTVTLASSVNPSNFQQSTTLTATVPSGATGTVTFYDGATSLGTGTVSSGSATLAIASLSVGTHTLTATYSGDGNWQTGTSSALTQTVGKGVATISVVSGTNPSTFGVSVTFTATVTSGATGTVQFMDGATAIGSPVTISSGTAAYTTTALTAGTHSITGVYSGDTNWQTATSSAVSQVVNKNSAETITLVSSDNPSTFGASVTFTATLPANATGTVTFYDGATSLGTGTLSGGVATLTTSALVVGTHSVTASYAGDSNYGSVTSSALSQVVGKGGVTVTASGVPNPSTFGQTVTMTITLVGSNGVVPTGTVSVADGATSLGSPVTLVNGAATFTTNALTAGTHTINVTYGGDANYF